MNENPTDVLQVVTEVIVTDLKLDDIKVDRETILVGGELGLDSLDLLMLVTGTEKRLGVKIPNEHLGRDNMETVGRFVEYVEGLQAQSGS
ncbi:MAG: acyl carrier protein [Phycisphaerales bacterium]|nr:acyl carrier protein [Phycisphaerales bacterium]